MKATNPSHAALALAWRLCLFAGVGAVLLLAPAAGAQDLPEPGDGFTWQRVGDQGIDVWGLAFGPDGTLWASGGDGPYRLDLSGGPPGVWERRLHSGVYTGPLLVLGRGPAGDTLLMGTGRTHRSVDGGWTWTQVHDRGGGGLYEVPEGYPHAGRILTGATGGAAHTSSIGYSDDRGATFTPAVVPSPDGNTASAYDFAALPPGSAYPGRILAAGRWGVNISDDGGQTWRESGLWQAVYYFCEGVEVVEHPGLLEWPGGSVGAVAGGLINGQALARAWASADGGETWGPAGGYPFLEGPPSGAGRVRAVLSLGGPSALVVLYAGTVYRTDDAGQTWVPVGRAPEIIPSTSVKTAVLGPDRRLYVGLHDNSAARGWVWRTAETHDPLPVSSEPEPGEETGVRLAVRPNPARDGAEVEVVLDRPSEVSVSLHDSTGRRVALLASGPHGAGRHTLVIEGERLAAGVYVVRVEAGSTVATRTVTLLR